jgi:AcrR family transcriptional regulator
MAGFGVLVKMLRVQLGDHPLAAAPPFDRDRPARTHRLLLAHAMALVRRGRIPSIAELAVQARVSRATAYRYFPSRSKLVSAVVAEGLAPVRRYRPRAVDGLGRVRELFDKTFPLFRRFEPHMRAALQLALEHESLERMGLLEEEPYRRGHRRYILHRAAAPLAEMLGAPAYARLIKALSLVYGIESYVVLRDIWGASYREVEAVARWMLEALIESALRQASARSEGRGRGGARRSAARPRTPSGELRWAGPPHLRSTAPVRAGGRPRPRVGPRQRRRAKA